MIKKISLLLLSLTFLVACNDTKKDNKEKVDHSKEVNLEEFPDMSIFHLPSEWTTQNNEEIQLKDLQGKTLVAVMIYTSCQAACPRLVADMRHIDRDLPKEVKDKVQFVFVSIDPEVDTPERLKEFAIENQMDNDKWVFLRGSEDNTREFAAVLAVSYKAIDPFDFSHSNIISVFNPQGELAYQREGLGLSNQGIIDAILEIEEN